MIEVIWLLQLIVSHNHQCVNLLQWVIFAHKYIIIIIIVFNRILIWIEIIGVDLNQWLEKCHIYSIECIYLFIFIHKIRVVFTGPLYLPTKFENNKKYVCYEVLNTNPPVAVPTHFFKIILCELKNNENNKVERVLASYIIPNKAIPPDTPLSTFS